MSGRNRKRVTLSEREGAADVEKLKAARILIVEDEPIIAFDIGTALAEAGATIVGPALSLGNAMNYAMKADLNAAVLDILLGRETSAEVARALSARGIPFLFYSGQVPGDSVRLEWPKTTIIPKPAPGRSLIIAVAELLAVTH